MWENEGGYNAKNKYDFDTKLSSVFVPKSEDSKQGDE